jgi:SAM-dependent methyltransferase
MQQFNMIKQHDSWNSSESYEFFMGRWSKLVASRFLKWLDAPNNLSWLDLGCGTGALSEAIYIHCEPKSVTGVDPSADFLEKAKEKLNKGEFIVGTSTHIPRGNESIERLVSGLALNFFHEIDNSFSEMKRVLKQDGEIGAYVWDYSDRMDFLRLFWDAAGRIDQKSRNLDEGVRFPICTSANLINAFQNAGLSNIKTTNLDIETYFSDFEDFWRPFLGGQGPAPGYLASLDSEHQKVLKNNIKERIRFESDGSFKLLGRAIAIKGKCK